METALGAYLSKMKEFMTSRVYERRGAARIIQSVASPGCNFSHARAATLFLKRKRFHLRSLSFLFLSEFRAPIYSPAILVP